MRKLIASVFLLSTIAASGQASAARNIVLVHGAFADGSGWRDIAEILEDKGYKVVVVQHPETSLEEDVVAVKRVLAAQDGPTVLVGHRYGGVVITQAGGDPKVESLVYVAAYAPVQLDPAVFHQDFCADLPQKTAHFMSISQVLPAATTFNTKISNPAWRLKPSWGIVATQDRAINPALQRFMYQRGGFTVSEIAGSHAVYMSRAKEVAAVIAKAESR